MDTTIVYTSAGNQYVDTRYVKAVGRCTVVALVKCFPRSWQDVMSTAYMARVLKPEQSISTRIKYIQRKHLQLSTGGRFNKNGRIVVLAKTNSEVDLLAKIVQTKSEEKAKQLRFETILDGTRNSAWRVIREMLGESFFEALKVHGIEPAIVASGLSRATAHRRLANVRARLIRP